jgi:hypothetical protein
MLTFTPRSQIQSWAFEVELGRLSALVSDMEQVGLGTPVEDLVAHAPLLDSWFVGSRSIPCLVGLSTGHPKLTGDNRSIITSDVWLISADGKWARTQSRWYQLGRPRDRLFGDS